MSKVAVNPGAQGHGELADALQANDVRFEMHAQLRRSFPLLDVGAHDALAGPQARGQPLDAGVPVVKRLRKHGVQVKLCVGGHVAVLWSKETMLMMSPIAPTMNTMPVCTSGF